MTAAQTLETLPTRDDAGAWIADDGQRRFAAGR
jgi:hypothetical protein